MKLDIKKTIKRLENGFYNEWVKGYITDLNAPNEVREVDMEIQKTLNVVIDFLQCRKIEKEQN